MKFVQRGVSRDNENRQQGPAQMHLTTSGADTAQDQQAQDEIFGEVRALANEVMDFEERSHRSAGEEPVKEWNDDAAGIFRGEQAG